MVMVDDAGDNCRCLALIPMNEIASTCRNAGGCAEHPKDTLPRGGAEGSEDRGPMCHCGHVANDHDSHGLAGDTCHGCDCKALRTGPHVHEWGEWKPDRLMRIEYAYCYCGASKARRAELEKPQEPEAERWKTARCRDCEEPIPQGCTLCQACADKPVCTHCQGPHALEDCKGLEEPEAHEHDWGKYTPMTDYGFGEQSRTCKTCGISEVHTGYLDPSELEAEPAPVPIPRRPPYAVAYAVEGGAQYEVAVSGDATVVAEDGALHILHPKKPVLAIVRIQPMDMEES